MLSDKIRTIRLAKGISQVDLGKAIGVSKQSVSNWENDNIQPSIDMLVQIADYFGVSTDYLLDRETTRTLDCKNLTEEEISHIQDLINDIAKYK